MGKGSIAKIAAALAIISVYIYLFGIVGTIDSLDSNLAEQYPENTAESFETTPKEEEAVPVIATTTTEASRTERVVYTYSTELNVVNGKKPSLADYTATEPILVVTQELTAPAAATTTTPPDFELNEEDVDYTLPPKTTTTTAAETTTTTTPVTVLTPACHNHN